MDASGFILNPARRRHIPTDFRALVAVLAEGYRLALGPRLHSIYLRGSLVRGSFRPGVSDIDSFALVHWPGLRWEALPTIVDQADFRPVRESVAKAAAAMNYRGTVEWMVSSYHPELHHVYPSLAMTIKTQSLCLEGENVAGFIPGYRPGREMLMHYKWLETDLDDFFRKEEITPQDCRSLMKLLLRCGFELVMERTGRYTADLYPAYRAFSQYYPKREQDMRKGLYFFLNPSAYTLALHPWLHTFGMWLLGEVKKKLYQS